MKLFNRSFIFVSIAILIIITLMICIVFYNINAKLKTLKIGKDLYIRITDDMNVDADFISDVLNERIYYKNVFFDMIDDEECQKLIDYMSQNNLVIESSLYVINQAWLFEQIIEVIKFKD